MYIHTGTHMIEYFLAPGSRPTKFVWFVRKQSAEATVSQVLALSTEYRQGTYIHLKYMRSEN